MGSVFTLTGREHSSASDSSLNASGGQQEAEGGETQASRMRHALPDEGIHLQHIQVRAPKNTYN